MKINLKIVLLLLALSGRHEVIAQWINFTSSNLPILIINFDEPTAAEKKSLTANIKIIDNGNKQRNNLTDTPGFTGSIRILNLDSAALTSSKKSFEFMTMDNQRLPKDVELLGMQAASNWVMDAVDNDNSYIRTFLGFKIFRMLGNYAPNIQYCEVVLNDEYWGLYLLKEVIAPGSRRLRISELDPDDVAGDSLTGGYIFKVTAYDTTSMGGWLSEHISEPRIFYQYYYPAVDKIAPEQAAFIQNIMTNFEFMMEGANYEDPNTGYEQFINVENFTDFAIINEISRPPNAFGLDAFMYYDGQSVTPWLHMGPVWNFDRTFNAGWNGWEIQKNPQPFWWKRLWGSCYFRQRESNNWYHLRRNQLTNVVLEELIDNQIRTLDEALNRNYIRWDPYFMSRPPDWDGSIQRLKDYLKYRIDWLDHLLLKVEPVPQNPHPEIFTLSPNFPNPFNANTRIEYYLAKSVKLRLEILDATGRLVCVLTDCVEPAGFHGKYWNGTDLFGQPVSSGVYFCRLNIESNFISRKMILLR